MRIIKILSVNLDLIAQDELYGYVDGDNTIKYSNLYRETFIRIFQFTHLD